MRMRIILAVLLTVLLLGIARRTSMRHSVEYLTETHGITFTHDTATEGFSEGALISLTATKTDKEVAVVRYADQPGGPYQELNMTPESGVYKVRLPAKEKGTKQYYHIEVFQDNIKIASFPTEGDQVVKYKGHVSTPIITGHILFMFATIFFGLLTVFTAVDLARGKGNLASQSCFCCLPLSPLILGDYRWESLLLAQHLETGWGGWPIGHDITDTKTEILLLFWFITFLLSWQALRGRKMTISNKTYSFLVILSFAVTFITFLIPHSL